MPKIELRFAISLVDYEFSSPGQNSGPLFHRWLPNGEANALTLEIKDPNAELRVWFNRYGFVSNDFIVFDQKKREVDPSVMERQAVLDAGPLFGGLILSKISEEELEAIGNGKEDDSLYLSMGKRIVQLIYEPIHRFLQILRVNFGQYWLRNLTAWDSRELSLGAYCSSMLNLKWRPDPNSEWSDFRPTKSVRSVTVTVPSDVEFKQYLQKEDFYSLPEVLDSGYTPNLASMCLIRSHQNRDIGVWSYAFIEAYTALELTISDLIRSRYSTSDSIKNARQTFFNLPKKAQLVSIASIEGTIPIEDLNLALLAIEIRNKVVHEGYDPPPNIENRKALNALLRVIAHFLSGPSFKFPKMNSGNRVYSEKKKITLTPNQPSNTKSKY